MVCSLAKILPHFVLSSELWGHETCVLVYFLFFVSVQIFFCWLICSRPIFQHIVNIAVPVWGHIHHLAQVLKPWKSELCLWITVHKNIFPLHPPQVALITDESLLSVVLTLLAVFLVCWGARPILSLAIFAKMNFTRSPQALRSTCIDRRGGLEYVYLWVTAAPSSLPHITPSISLLLSCPVVVGNVPTAYRSAWTACMHVWVCVCVHTCVFKHFLWNIVHL